MFWDRAGLDRRLYGALTAQLPRSRVLAYGTGPGGLVVAGLVTHLAVWEPSSWSVTPWHEVLTASWDQEQHRLSWTTQAGDHAVELTTPGRVPGLLRERVQASVVTGENLVVGGVDLVISARRDLADPNGPLLWRVTGASQALLARDDIRSVTDRRIAELKTELGR